MNKEEFLNHLITVLGDIHAQIIICYLDQYQDRLFYKDWIIPDHNKIKKMLRMPSTVYYKVLDDLQSIGFIEKLKDEKSKKMMYRVILDRIINR